MTSSTGLIGLGNAGMALLAALARHGPVMVFDKDAGRYAGLSEAGGCEAIIADSALDLAARCELVVLSLPNPDASRAVAGQLAGALRPGSVLIETSTIAPEDVEALADIVAPSGARVIDAAIVGGVAKLAAGQGTFLIGSPEAEAGAAGDMLRSIAEEIFFLAKPGDGMRAKIAVNAVAHAVYAVLVEAGALAAAQGIPVDIYQRLLQRESGLLRPLTHRFSGRLRHGDFEGGMPTINALKDSRLALAAAQALGVDAPTLAAAHGLYEKAVEAGLGARDYAALGTLWEEKLGISFA